MNHRRMNRSRAGRVGVFLGVLLFLLPQLLVAQEQESPAVRAQLLLEPTALGRPFRVVIRFTIKEGWHLYWINPGDSGLPIDVQWELPKGYKAEPVQYPTPEKYVEAGLIAYGYKHEVELLATIVPPAGSASRKPVKIVAKLDWLACKESCVPGSARVEAVRSDPKGSGPWISTSALNSCESKLPRSDLSQIGAHVKAARVLAEGSERVIRIAVAGLDHLSGADFYPEPIKEATIDHRNITVAGGVIDIPVTPYREATVFTRVRGLLIVNGTGYRLQAAINPS